MRRQRVLLTNAFCVRGKKYFYHSITKETKWRKP